MKYLIRLFILFSLTAHAHDSDQATCEHGIHLPQGYEFVEFTTDCNHNENLIPIKHANRYGYANTKGDIVIKPAFEMAYGFDEGLALIKQNGKYGFIDNTGKIIVKAVYDEAWGFLDGRANVVINGKYGFIDKTGNMVIKAMYDKTGQWFESGLVPAKQGDKWGYINHQGIPIIPFIYNVADDFSENLAVVAQYNNDTLKFGYIDTNGNTILPLAYDRAFGFVGGTAMVITKDELYHINPKGEKVAPSLTN
ncbi:MAG: WG repeat-containing protein [Moraxella sp.]|nr:WG repeat-containing protein [Moraxella sp.]